MSKKPKTTRVPISMAQATALIALYQNLDASRQSHVAYFFQLISQPVPSDANRRDLYAILAAEVPDALAFLGQILRHWVDVGNATTQMAQADVDRISFGPPIPVMEDREAPPPPDLKTTH